MIFILINSISPDTISPLPENPVISNTSSSSSDGVAPNCSNTYLISLDFENTDLSVFSLVYFSYSYSIMSLINVKRTFSSQILDISVCSRLKHLNDNKIKNEL